MTSAEHIPVIAAIGEHTFRPQTLEQAKEPIDLMADALRAACDDCHADILPMLDKVAVIGVFSWRYKDPAGLLCDRLSINPKHKIKAGMGGEKPLRLIHEAALDIQNGKAQAVAIVGGEAQNAIRKARRADIHLDWTPLVTMEEAWGDITDTTLGAHKEATRLGIQAPVQVYPFFENALAARLGQTPKKALHHSAEIWARYAQVSLENPYAWNQTAYDATSIATISQSNRMISFPYPKLMVSNDSVNQAGTVIVMSLAKARAAGIPEDNLIFIHGAAAANEPNDFLSRGRYDTYPAMTAVLSDITKDNHCVPDMMELYSCFPVVPKAALEVLDNCGVDPSLAPTVAGGLTFFGGPFNNYMAHATTAMVRKLRGGDGQHGLLYGQGGVITKHYALLLSRAENSAPLSETYCVQDEADRLRGDVPSITASHEGPATVETYTAFYAPDGTPVKGIVIARTPNNERLIADVPAADTETLSLITDFEVNAVGVAGTTQMTEHETLHWKAA